MTIQEISDLMDSKLEPIKNKLETIEIEMKAVRTHLELVNARLIKLEQLSTESITTKY